MKKIGILTFHRAINNGAVLQAYALANALNLMGCDAKYIDYTAQRIKEDYNIVPLLKRRTIKSVGVYFLFDINILISHRKFNEFIEKNIPLSLCNICNQEELTERFDILLSGGDQIWNLRLTGGDINYYLAFTNKIRKFSYGTSFGRSDFSEAECKKISCFLKEYDKLFVREESGKNLIHTLIKTECKVVPDPVFLLSKKEWIERLDLNDEKFKEKKYILFFELHDNLSMRKHALNLAKKYKCKVLRITNDFFEINGMKNIKRTGPIEFLKYILYAKMVITDSFHASAFSLIFNKQLYIGLKEGELAYLNTRMDYLINTYQIQNCVITNSMSEDATINYTKVNEIIEMERKKGFEALKEIVND